MTGKSKLPDVDSAECISDWLLAVAHTFVAAADLWPLHNSASDQVSCHWPNNIESALHKYGKNFRALMSRKLSNAIANVIPTAADIGYPCAMALHQIHRHYYYSSKLAHFRQSKVDGIRSAFSIQHINLAILSYYQLSKRHCQCLQSLFAIMESSIVSPAQFWSLKRDELSTQQRSWLESVIDHIAKSASESAKSMHTERS